MQETVRLNANSANEPPWERPLHAWLAALSVVVLVAATASFGVSSVAHADEVRSSQWYLDAFDIDKIHELSQGAGVTIGVIDSGIDPDHPDLDGNVKAGKDFTGDTDDGLKDNKGHGTAVASVLAGHGHGDNGTDGIMGIAPKATIIPARVNKSDESTPSDTVTAAIEWLTEQDVDIISVSMGVVPTSPGFDAVEAATDQGIAVVASAGNNIEDPSLGDHQDTTTHWPASSPGAIPVTATNQDDTTWEKSLTLKNAAKQPQLGLSAPGVDIPIALPDGKYDTVNGTSFSAPTVAGTLALIKSAYPDLDYTTWTARMLETVDDKGDKGFDDKYGWGIVNPLKALTEDINFKDQYDTIESNASDILPLDEQGKDTSDTDPGNSTSPSIDAQSSSDSGEALTGTTTGIPPWAIIATAAAIMLIAAIVTVIAMHRRKKTGTPALSAGQPIDAAPPAGYPPHQPGPNPYLAPPQQPTPPTHPPQ